MGKIDAIRDVPVRVTAGFAPGPPHFPDAGQAPKITPQVFQYQGVQNQRVSGGGKTLPRMPLQAFLAAAERLASHGQAMVHQGSRQAERPPTTGVAGFPAPAYRTGDPGGARSSVPTQGIPVPSFRTRPLMAAERMQRLFAPTVHAIAPPRPHIGTPPTASADTHVTTAIHAAIQQLMNARRRAGPPSHHRPPISHEVKGTLSSWQPPRRLSGYEETAAAAYAFNFYNNALDAAPGLEGRKIEPHELRRMGAAIAALPAEASIPYVYRPHANTARKLGHFLLRTWKQKGTNLGPELKAAAHRVGARWERDQRAHRSQFSATMEEETLRHGTSAQDDDYHRPGGKSFGW